MPPCEKSTILYRGGRVLESPSNTRTITIKSENVRYTFRLPQLIASVTLSITIRIKVHKYTIRDLGINGRIDTRKRKQIIDSLKHDISEVFPYLSYSAPSEVISLFLQYWEFVNTDWLLGERRTVHDERYRRPDDSTISNRPWIHSILDAF